MHAHKVIGVELKNSWLSEAVRRILFIQTDQPTTEVAKSLGCDVSCDSRYLFQLLEA